jgi:hypothetical protein
MGLIVSGGDDWVGGREANRITPRPQYNFSGRSGQIHYGHATLTKANWDLYERMECVW